MNAQAIRLAAVSLAVAGTATMSGCSKEADQPNASADITLRNDTVAAEAEPRRSRPAEADPAPASNASVEPEPEQPSIPPETPLSRDAQMLEDAGASGMTARMPTDADPAPASNGSQDAATR